MYTVIESPLFIKTAEAIWSDDERSAFINWLAENPQAGDVVPGSGGCRKVRWGRAGTGKSGGVRVITFNRLESGEILLLYLYAKSVRGNIPAHLLKAILEETRHARKKVHHRN